MHVSELVGSAQVKYGFALQLQQLSLSLADECLEGVDAALGLTGLRTHHRLLYHIGDLLRRLAEHLVHVLRHGVVGAEILVR